MKIPSAVRHVPAWVWLVELLGVVMVGLGWAWSGYAEAAMLQFGSALMLVLPFALFDRALEERLGRRITQEVGAAIRAAEAFELSWQPRAANPEDLSAWPFTGTARRDGPANVRLALHPSLQAPPHGEPLEATIVVKDPVDRTFIRRHQHDGTFSSEIVSFRWPDDFTSGADIPSGVHTATWFVRSLEAGPQARSGRACAIEFGYPASDSSGTP